MEKQAIEIIKDLFISLLIVICIIIILSFVFYDKIALGKVIPEVDEYVLSNEMQDALENTELENTQEVIINYYIDAGDLKKYETTKEYDKGKSNPFATEEIFNNVVGGNETDGNNTSSPTNNSNASNNFYEDDVTK